MIIIKDIYFQIQLSKILFYISKDKRSAAIKFEKELNKKILAIVSYPEKYRKSYYFDDENYRDLVYKGYTIIYKIEMDKNRILILEIFKWQSR